MASARRTALLRALKSTALIDGVASTLIVGFGLSRGWTTATPFGYAFLAVGGAILAFGVMSLRRQRLLPDDSRPLADQQRLYGVRQTLRHQMQVEVHQARTLMDILGTASLPLLVVGLILGFAI